MNTIKRTLWVTALVVAAILVSARAFAQVDLSGTWANPQGEDWVEESPGPDAVDYLGIPLSDEGRAVALSYSASILANPERQCAYYVPLYTVLGPFGLKIWNEGDPVTSKTVAWKMGGWIDKNVVSIWMDGRPHPSQYQICRSLAHC